MTLARTHSIALVGVQGHVNDRDRGRHRERGWSRSCSSGSRTVGPAGGAGPDQGGHFVNSGQQWPQRRITVGLSPASLPKRGSGFDLSIALAILAAAGSIRPVWLAGTVFLGELGLDGRLRPVPGVLPAVVAAARAGFSRVVTPPDNIAEAALVPGVRVAAPATLAALVNWLAGRDDGRGDADVVVAEPGRPPLRPPAGGPNRESGQLPGMAGLVVCPAVAGEPHRDLADFAGQPVARRAAEICAAGGHHLMLTGLRGWVKRRCSRRPASDDHARRCRPADALEGQRRSTRSAGADPGAVAADDVAVLRPRITPRLSSAHRRRRQRHHQARRGVAGAPRLPVPGRGTGV